MSPSKIKSKNAYELLGVDENTPTKQIEKQYLRLAVKYHPDLNPCNPKAEEKFKEVEQAWNLLKGLDDPLGRRKVSGIEDLDDLFGDFSKGDAFCIGNLEINKRGEKYAEEWSDFYFDIYTTSVFDPEPGWEEVGVENFLIQACKVQGEEINPLYLRPFLKYFGLEGRLDENDFCRYLSRPDVDPWEKTKSLEKILPSDKSMSFFLSLKDMTEPEFTVSVDEEGYRVTIKDVEIKTQNLSFGPGNLFSVPYEQEPDELISPTQYKLMKYLITRDRTIAAGFMKQLGMG